MGFATYGERERERGKSTSLLQVKGSLVILCLCMFQNYIILNLMISIIRQTIMTISFVSNSPPPPPPTPHSSPLSPTATSA